MSSRDEWMADGLCRQVDNEPWFPEKGGSVREAKLVCLRCDVRQQCLQYALDNQERFGIWGGLSERERRKLLPPVGQANGRTLTPDQEKRAIAMLRRGMTPTDVAHRFGVSFHVIRRLRDLPSTMNGEAA